MFHMSLCMSVKLQCWFVFICIWYSNNLVCLERKVSLLLFTNNYTIWLILFILHNSKKILFVIVLVTLCVQSRILYLIYSTKGHRESMVLCKYTKWFSLFAGNLFFFWYHDIFISLAIIVVIWNITYTMFIIICFGHVFVYILENL